MNKFHISPCAAALLITSTAGLTCCATRPSTAKLDAKTNAVLTAMSSKLASAATLRVRATRTVSPDITHGGSLAEEASGTVVVRRPDTLVSRSKTNLGSRSIALNGGTLTLVDYGAGTHAAVPAPGSIDTAVRGVYEAYSVMPPVAELLVNDPRTFLLDGVLSGTWAGGERAGGVECDKLVFQQEGLAWALWVSTTDFLPRKITQTRTANGEETPRTITATLSNWELNPKISGRDFSVTIPAGSQAVDMIPIQP